MWRYCFNVSNLVSSISPLTAFTYSQSCQCADITNHDICISDKISWPQMEQDWFRNFSNLEQNQIMDLTYACIRMLFTKFMTVKMLHTCTYRSMTRHSPGSSSNIKYFLYYVAYAKCSLYEINENNSEQAVHRRSPVQKLFWDRTKAMLDWIGLSKVYWGQVFTAKWPNQQCQSAEER